MLVQVSCYQECAFEPQASRSASELSLGAKDEQKQASRGVEEDEDIDLGPGMFDEDAAVLMTAGASAAAKSIADMVMPWGGYSGAKKKGSKLKSKPPSIRQHLSQSIWSSIVTLRTHLYQFNHTLLAKICMHSHHALQLT